MTEIPTTTYNNRHPEAKSVDLVPSQLLRVGEIVGMHYSSAKETDTVVIYGIGAPIPPDNGTLPDAPYIVAKNTDVFVPDYIGYGRSDGEFTPENCIRTFTDIYEKFNEGIIGTNSYENTRVPLKYEHILFVGRSLGGTYVPLLPRFNPEITDLAIFCPVVDSKSCGSIEGEETNEQFLRSMKEDGYHHLYRGVLDDTWRKHLENDDDLSPMDNIDHLKNAKLFIGHGLLDACVNYTKSQAYLEKILERFPNLADQFKLKIYEDGDHGRSTTNKAIVDFLGWIGI